MLIFRRTNCIITTSGIVTLCKQSYSMPVESGLQSALKKKKTPSFRVIGLLAVLNCSNTEIVDSGPT